MLVTTELLARLTGRSLTAHLGRGAIGAGIFVVGALQATARPYLAVILMLLSLIPLGGCPACWLGGLFKGACEVRSGSKLPPQ